jgi:4-carboxymuconolactone decarboxylase
VPEEVPVSGDDDRLSHGMQVRRAVLGDEHVDRAVAASSPLDEAFQTYITGSAWADVWGRDGLDRPTRSLVTIALLAALGHDHELEMHLRAAHRTGASPDAIGEVLLHVALYAGVPAANRAFAALKRVEAARETTAGHDDDADEDGGASR